MVAALRERPYLVFALLGAYFIANVIVRLSLPHSLELDEGQQLFLAQWLAVGYDSQPPFYNWLQYGAEQVLGPTLASLSVLKNLVLFLSYLFFGLTAFMVLRSRELAIIATLGLLTMPQVSFEAQRDLTHTVAVIFTSCLFLFALVKAILAPSLFTYALTGLAIGLGMIAKYNFVLLPAAALLAMLAEPDFRRRLFDWRILLTAAIALIVVLPHGLWFIDHLDAATGRTIGKLTAEDSTSRLSQILTGLTSLALAFAGFAALTLVLFAIVFGRDMARAWKASSPWSRLIGRIMLISAVALVVVVLFGASNIKDRWLTPIYLVLPLYLCLKIEAAGLASERHLPRFLPIGFGLMVLIPLVLFVRIPLHGQLGKYEKINVPYAMAVEQILASDANRPSLILADDQQLAGNIRLNAPEIPVTIPGYEAFETPYAFDATHPLLVVWRNRGRETMPLPEDLARWVAAHGKPEIGEAKTIALPYIFGREGDLYHFAYAFLYPQAK
ncbi:MAG: glycosyltransferase family 39 protein [Arenimonas sp.]|nr:glycosyltransferase family 39 protein [Arenimonas sp.]